MMHVGKGLSVLAMPPPPPPPSPSVKTGGKVRKGLIAVVLIAVVLVSVVVLFFFGVIPWPFKSGGGGNVSYGVVMGKVVDTYGYPVSNVTVTVAGQSVMTNDQGWFSVSDVAPQNKVVVVFSRNGSAPTYQIANVQTGRSSFVEATMSSVDVATSFDAADGARVENLVDGGFVEFGPDSLVTGQGSMFTGTASVSLTVFDPSVEAEAAAFPGEYLGVSAGNQTAVPIKSFGFMDVSVVSSSGQVLTLAVGKNATVSIPVPFSLQVEAEALGTCPLWYFDAASGVWREEGFGVYDVGSGCFVGNVTHLSTWNFDIRYPAAYVSGRVVNSNGDPVEGAQVKCWGTGWYQQRWASGETLTTVNGTFRRIPVEVGVVFKYQASKNGQQSLVLQAGPLGQGQEVDVGDIVLDAPLVQVTLIWGENPSDLDSHLAVRLVGNSTFHVYYGSEGSLGSEPYAFLDTDDTSGFGPEVVSVSKLREGKCRYSVRHYAGEGNISTSGAEVNLVVPDLGIYRFTPPSGQAVDTDIWRVFELVVDSHGRVTAVNTINDYVKGDNHSDLLYPPP